MSSTFESVKQAVEHPERHMCGPWAKYTWPTGGAVIDLEAFNKLPRRKQQAILKRIPKTEEVHRS